MIRKATTGPLIKRLLYCDIVSIDLSYGSGKVRRTA